MCRRSKLLSTCDLDFANKSKLDRVELSKLSSDRVSLLKQRSNYWQIIPYLNPHWRMISVGLFCVVVFSLFSPVMAYLAGDISKYLGAGNVELLIQLSLIGGLVFVIRGIAQYGQDALMAKVAFSVTLDLRKRIYNHLLKRFGNAIIVVDLILLYFKYDGKLI